MRLLVCGGRTFGFDAPIETYELVKRELIKTIYGRSPITCIIHGNASGADTLADQAAQWFGWPVEKYPANWKKYGKAAGPIRNQQMLDEGKPDLVIAFPGGEGTADMITRAKKAGVKVIQIERETV